MFTVYNINMHDKLVRFDQVCLYEDANYLKDCVKHSLEEYVCVAWTPIIGFYFYEIVESPKSIFCDNISQSCNDKHMIRFEEFGKGPTHQHSCQAPTGDHNYLAN